MKYFIPMRLIRHCGSFNGREIHLYNKNSSRWQKFYDCKKVDDKYGFIGEAPRLDVYFKRVIHAIKTPTKLTPGW